MQLGMSIRNGKMGLLVCSQWKEKQNHSRRSTNIANALKGLEELQTLLFTEREVLSLNGFSQSQDCPYTVSTHHPWVCLFTKWTPHTACTASDQLHVEALIVSFAPPLVPSKRLLAAPSACSDWFGCLIVVTPIFCHFFSFLKAVTFVLIFLESD